ncbi:SGNH hydrolase [Glarea lozoyensis ATCC 20868]|uniref:SGNH hydrolase n=1 Tax=Glarea lozoyensis (strain ATCC 20868 / MF5171) TaxID=1116229 RepID=S3D5I3_GLAL2|nr:SGNH hydrolase [Glarea lozoyensis ATCC 20868]EPE27326.1 SGNH hydrolase [Glarea lozoyensis ATCC 20868]
MHILTPLIFLSSLTTASLLPFASRTDTHLLPPAFFLAGDSTTAIQALTNTSKGGGWGTGFLSTLKNGAKGTNYGHNGATTVSFVAGGDWANVLKGVREAEGKYRPFVTISFGHNDQKPAANISLAQYSTNLRSLAQQILDLNATPILVTSLSRRNFNASGLVTRNLENERLATIAVAKSLDVTYVDLNLASMNYLNAIGLAKATTYNLEPTDFTHLNDMGSRVFGNLVAALVLETGLGKGLREWVGVDWRVVQGIRRGIYVTA